MKHYLRLYWSALTGASDIAPESADEIHELQRRAWDECGLMVVSVADVRLADEHRVDLDRIGERLFGHARRGFRPSRR
ncbi:conserved hypothetical protein [Haloferula helveola]|uniref:Uncharacterized protein n=1 Tax=Haloferula helveola TaxID=490095 RepID=A0ABN6H4T2_9BACT|nr:conserved hypothetical protein [Haloferula helveola]